MNLKYVLISLTLLATGCGSTYKYYDVIQIDTKLDSKKGVLISTPEDGWFKVIQYHNSGKMTANEIRAAFSKESSRVDLVTNCHGDDCLNNINIEKYGYYIKPEILHWEDRNTEWSGVTGRIEIQLIIYDAVTKKELANTSYKGRGNWLTYGGDHPQDLLQEPINEYVKSLYR